MKTPRRWSMRGDASSAGRRRPWLRSSVAIVRLALGNLRGTRGRQQAAARIVVVHRLRELGEGALLRARQVPGNLDLEAVMDVATSPASRPGRALAAQPLHGPVLGSR